MSIEAVRTYFRPLGRETDILEFSESSATVELAAQAVGVIPARIAKSLSFLTPEGCVLIIAAGDARVDNSKYKHHFGVKAKMLTPEQVWSIPATPSAACAPLPSPVRTSGSIWTSLFSGLTLYFLPQEAPTPPLS